MTHEMTRGPFLDLHRRTVPHKDICTHQRRHIPRPGGTDFQDRNNLVLFQFVQDLCQDRWVQGWLHLPCIQLAPDIRKLKRMILTSVYDFSV